MAEKTTDYFEQYRIGGYRLGVNLPMKGAVWENVARASRWGAPVIEINASAEQLGNNALQVIKELAQANDLNYTWHIPPNPQQAGELAMPDQPQLNDFARNVFIQALKAADTVGAKHITFHPTLQAGRPPDDMAYVYDVQNKKTGGVRVLTGMTPEESVRMANETAKARLETSYHSLKANLSVVSQLDDAAGSIIDYGIDRNKIIAMKGIVEAMNNMRGYQQLAVVPPDIDAWDKVVRKVERNERLTTDDASLVRNFAQNVKQQMSSYRTTFNNNLKELEQFRGKDLMLDGEDYMKQNVADNFGKMVDQNRRVFENAMKKGVSIGIENLPGNQLFSTPEEMNDIRERIVNKLVEKGFSKAKAEQFVGFTFDLSHANTIKYMDIKGERYANAGEFPEKLKGPIKHVHLSDTVGTFDAHLPVGQGELVEDQMDKMKKALRKSGFKGTSIHELGGSQIPALYQASMAFIEPGMYSVGEIPTSSQWGPSYLMASMTDPIVFSSKETGYFHETFGEIF